MCECFFFFSSRRRHTRSDRDWSSDVCSSDLQPEELPVPDMGYVVGDVGAGEPEIEDGDLGLPDRHEAAVDERDACRRVNGQGIMRNRCYGGSVVRCHAAPPRLALAASLGEAHNFVNGTLT